MTALPVANAAGDFAEVLGAVVGLGWLLLVGAVLWSLRDEGRNLVRRIRRVDTMLGSAEIGEEVRELEEAVDESEAAIRQQLPTGPSDTDAAASRGDSILELTSREPRLGLIRLVTAIEERVRDLASIAGHEQPASPWPLLLEWLVHHGSVPPGVASSTDLIRSVRNRVVHGLDEEIDDREVAASIDAGLRLLRSLDAIPREGYEVAAPLLPVYRDEEAQESYDDVRGVVLWEFDAAGRRQAYHVRPTRQAYEPGQRVGWQWSFDKTWGEAFWRDPFDDGRIKLAWSESAEFVGQPLIRQPNLPVRATSTPSDEPGEAAR